MIAWLTSLYRYYQRKIWAKRIRKIFDQSQSLGEFYSLVGHAVACGKLPVGVLETMGVGAAIDRTILAMNLDEDDE